MYRDDQIAPAETEVSIERGTDGYVSSPYRLLDSVGPLELPIGYLEGDINFKDAEVCVMRGEEEDLVGNPKTREPMARLVANCTTKLGEIEMPYEGRSPDDRAKMLKTIKSLTIIDLTFLLVAIRMRSFREGKAYRFNITCPSRACKQRKATHVARLDELTVRPAPMGMRRLHEVELWESKKKVRFELTKANEIDRIMALVNHNEASAPSAALYASIIDVDGAKLARIGDLQKWAVGDRDELREAIRDAHAYGFDMKVETDNCPECGTTINVELDITPSFFRPTAIRQT